MAGIWSGVALEIMGFVGCGEVLFARIGYAVEESSIDGRMGARICINLAVTEWICERLRKVLGEIRANERGIS